MKTLTNPILPGFHPDPSILRVGDDFYIATSTFEWFPGVALHHSRDLVHWERLPCALNRTSQLDMAGVPDSGGIWAPCLSHDGNRFYLIYTNVLSYDGAFKDTPNYLVTADDIRGPWSEPVYLNSSGFDPSLFHDDDGRKWLVNMVWDHRPGNNPFYGIILQEYDTAAGKLTGPARIIFKGTELGCTEGPHLYKRSGWYYLFTAEGGTGYEHAVTVARSRSIDGPYEVHPDNPILTSRGDRPLPLQKTGHASIIETPGGEWYMVFLCSRPLDNGRCILGRETGLEQIRWNDRGWPELTGGGNHARKEVPAPALPEFRPEIPAGTGTFDSRELSLEFHTLRRPADSSWLSLSERPGWLRLQGGESLTSTFGQSLVARRVDSLEFTAETGVDFAPDHFQQLAGLVCYYNTKLWHYLHISRDEEKGRVLAILTNDHMRFSSAGSSIPLPDTGTPVRLRAEGSGGRLVFTFSVDNGTTWTAAGPSLDLSILSDDYATRYPEPGWGFTGAFVGMACQDLLGSGKTAFFDRFDYRSSGSSSL